jgi:hypothetical protein
MPLRSKSELVTQRRNTLSYISAAYDNIVLHRKHISKNIRGGTSSNEVSLDPQRMRVLHGYVGRRKDQNAPNSPSMGEVPFAKDVLIARWDADVKRGDWFVLDDVKYEVSHVFTNNSEFELLANLTNTGPAVNG